MRFTVKRALLVLILFVALPVAAATVNVVYGNPVTTTIVITCQDNQGQPCDVTRDRTRIPDAAGLANGATSIHVQDSAHITRANLATCAALLDP